VSLGPFDVVPVIERIREQCPQFRKVEGAAELASIDKQGNEVVPAAYVVLAQEQPRAKTGGTLRVIQDVVVSFAVILVIRQYRVADLGTAASNAFRPLIAAVREAVVGWRPDAYHAATELGEGRLLRYSDTTLTWNQVFRTSYQARN
jgi:hypothetical protein